MPEDERPQIWLLAGASPNVIGDPAEIDGAGFVGAGEAVYITCADRRHGTWAGTTPETAAFAGPHLCAPESQPDALTNTWRRSRRGER